MIARDTLALVMAGGRGSRLLQLTAHRAKPAVAFGGNLRIIDFTLSNCINSGIRRIGVLTQYQGGSLLRHLQQSWGFLQGALGEFIEALPAEQRGGDASWYAGTADAVFQNLAFVRHHDAPFTLVLAGDHVYRMDYAAMVAEHERSGAKVTVGCVEVPCAEASDFGVMQADACGRVVHFEEKPRHPRSLPGKPGIALASMGIYVFDTAFLVEQLAGDARNAASGHDFGKDVVPAAIRSAGVHTYRMTDPDDPQRQGYWRDVGTVDAYWEANLQLAGVKPELNLYDRTWPVLSRQPPLPPAKFVFDRPTMRGSAADSLVAAGCIVSGARVRRSVLFNEARVETGSIVNESLLLPGARVGPGCRLRRVVVDEGCVVPDGIAIGEDVNEDARWFEVTGRGVVLVTQPMLDAWSQRPRLALEHKPSSSVPAQWAA